MKSSRLPYLAISAAIFALVATGCQVSDEVLSLETVAMEAEATNGTGAMATPATVSPPVNALAPAASTNDPPAANPSPAQPSQVEAQGNPAAGMAPSTGQQAAPDPGPAPQPEPERRSTCPLRNRQESSPPQQARPADVEYTLSGEPDSGSNTGSSGDCNRQRQQPTGDTGNHETPAPAPAPAPAPDPEPGSSGGNMTGDPDTVDVNTEPASNSGPETKSSDLLNTLRNGRGLSPLARNAEMDRFAREWSQQMASTQDFKHSDGPYGENIAYIGNTRMTADEAAERFHNMWVNSPGHYQNMTGSRYTEIGVGIVLGSDGWYGTHVFS